MASVATFLFNHLDFISTLTTGLFTGGAIYASTIQEPAIDQVGLKEHWQFFSPMYKRALRIQGFYLVVTTITGVLHGALMVNSEFDRNLWILSAIAMGSILPYTYFFLVPTNDTIIDDVDHMKNDDERSNFSKTAQKKLLYKWYWLHFVRSVIGFIAFSAMLYAISRRK